MNNVLSTIALVSWTLVITSISIAHHCDKVKPKPVKTNHFDFLQTQDSCCDDLPVVTEKIEDLQVHLNQE